MSTILHSKRSFHNFATHQSIGGASCTPPRPHKRVCTSSGFGSSDHQQFSSSHQPHFFPATQLSDAEIVQFSKTKSKRTGEPLFTLSQLKRVVAERENQLQLEYENTLLQLLDEQFQSFTQYNEDYLRRQINRSNPNDAAMTYIG